MRPNELVLRCFAQRRGDVWLAFCLDLNVGVQGSDMVDAKARLDSAVKSYLYDAFEGDDREHVADLFPRSAPADIWLRYYLLSLKHELLCLVGLRKKDKKGRKDKKDRSRQGGYTFKEVIPARFGVA